MNDFTKTELEDLYYAIRFFWKNRSSYDLPSDTEDMTNSYHLMKKINTMIDNYCEHEWRVGRHLFNDVYCLKCTKSIKCIHE